MSVTNFSFFNVAYATIAPYLLPIIAVVVGLFLILSLTTSYVYTGDTIQDRFESMIDIFSNFFGSIIDSVKNGFNNVMDAIKGLIPSMDDIWEGLKDRVMSYVPDLSGIWDEIKGNVQMMIDYAVPTMNDIWTFIQDKIDSTYDFVGQTKDQIENVVMDTINDYFIAEGLDPLFDWMADYQWNYNASLLSNLWDGTEALTEAIIRRIPGMDWIIDNATSIEGYLDKYI
ncbi:hypothetical protein LI82_05040 [Methanococcoides methylutens]|uniref:Uncharacterized protein n=1 Tax=Methanococcoides methylutens TaxID=2226 RepID=A0A099T594_METMT|nr:hypothetical protein [Methanococcoides methylutens]KGK99371.1 hypothetical protein LI82_05040 [Methanococcoides methylutens]